MFARASIAFFVSAPVQADDTRSADDFPNGLETQGDVILSFR